MKRSIYVVIKFASETLSVVALEKNLDKFHDFFSKTEKCTTFEMMQSFIKVAIKTIETKINGQIKKIFVQIDDTKKLGLNVTLIGHKQTITTETIQKSVLKNILINVKQEFSGAKFETIFAQPIKYLVKESLIQNVTYLTPPIDKKALEVEVICAKIAINQEIITKIKHFLKSLKLEVIDFVVTSNVIPFLVADQAITTSGMVNLHFHKKFSTISVIQNNALMNYKIINLGSDHLISQLAKNFNLSNSLVTKLFKANQAFFLNPNAQIDFEEKIISNSLITYQDFVSVTKKFLSEVFEETKFFLITHAIQNKLPLFITGKMSQLVDFEAYVKNFFLRKDIYFYQSKYENYLSQSEDSFEAIGVVKYINQFAQLIDYQKYHTLIDTQPVKISNLLPNKLSLFQVIIKKTFNKKNLGGKNA